MVAQYITEHGIFAKSHLQSIDGSVCCYLGKKNLSQ
jgi:hypothetical protein